MVAENVFSRSFHLILQTKRLLLLTNARNRFDSESEMGLVLPVEGLVTERNSEYLLVYWSNHVNGFFLTPIEIGYTAPEVLKGTRFEFPRVSGRLPPLMKGQCLDMVQEKFG